MRSNRTNPKDQNQNKPSPQKNQKENAKNEKPVNFVDSESNTKTNLDTSKKTIPKPPWETSSKVEIPQISMTGNPKGHGRVEKILETSFDTAIDVTARASSTTKRSVSAMASGTRNVVGKTASITATQLNRYTPDFYDVGHKGKGDLTSEMGMFALGNAAMVTQNAYRMAKVPAKYVLRTRNNIQYRESRMKHHLEKSENIIEANPLAKMNYVNLMVGKDHRNIIHYRDRLAWNRFERSKNKAGVLSKRQRAYIMKKKYDANRYSRMVKRSKKLEYRYNRMKASQFSLKRSLKGMTYNQSRKLMNQIVSGNDADSTVNRAMWMGQKSIRVGAKTAKEAWKHRQLIKKYAGKFMHPIRTIKEMIQIAVNLVTSILAFVSGILTSIPVILSILVTLLPVIMIILIFITLFGWIGLANQQAIVNVNTVANRDYAANAFIYEAKQRNWKDNAIAGVLAYMLCEGMSEDMGTYTYESYFMVPGPSGEDHDKTMDNDSWLDWINSDAKNLMRQTSSYMNRTDLYSAVGFGLMQDSDVWKTYNSKETQNATKLIQYAESKNKPWQDAQTQLTYYFEHIFNRPGVFDTVGVDPTKDNRSAEEWCRRITAGYGMPAWSWTNNGSYMQAHIQKVPLAQKYVEEYRAFDYIDIFAGNVAGSPNFNNSEAWRPPNNPYASAGLYGQCTWFAWGRFYEIYGFSPGFTGNGYQCVSQLLMHHPDKFHFSMEPVPGAVGSSDIAHNHVFIVIGVNGDNVTIQEGNLDGVTNNWNVAITDWQTKTYSKATLRQIYGNVTYAAPFKF